MTHLCEFVFSLHSFAPVRRRPHSPAVDRAEHATSVASDHDIKVDSLSRRVTQEYLMATFQLSTGLGRPSSGDVATEMPSPAAEADGNCRPCMADTCLPDRHTPRVAESRGGDALGDLNMHTDSTFEGKTCHNRQADPGNTQQGLTGASRGTTRTPIDCRDPPTTAEPCSRTRP